MHWLIDYYLTPRYFNNIHDKNKINTNKAYIFVVYNRDEGWLNLINNL